MSWPGDAAPHLRHRMELRGIYELRCVDCSVTLLIHREPGRSTPQPLPWRYGPGRAGGPEGGRAGEA